VTFLKEDFELSVYFLGFVFFASISGYNFVKYASIAKLHHKSLTDSLRTIQIFSLLSLGALLYFSLYMRLSFLYAAIILGILTLFYAIPIFPKESNLRTISGLKIYIIALVWALVAGLLPNFYVGEPITTDTVVLIMQYALFVLAITLPFEIRDLNYDVPQLATIPQRIGVKNTKILGLLLLFLMVVLEVWKNDSSIENVMISVGIVLAASLALLCSSKAQSKHYSSFWVESLPIFWAILAYLFI